MCGGAGVICESGWQQLNAGSSTSASDPAAAPDDACDGAGVIRESGRQQVGAPIAGDGSGNQASPCTGLGVICEGGWRQLNVPVDALSVEARPQASRLEPMLDLS